MHVFTGHSIVVLVINLPHQKQQQQQQRTKNARHLSCCFPFAGGALGGTDYAIRPNIAPGSTVTFAANEPTVDCEIDIIEDSIREEDEFFEAKVATTGTGFLGPQDITTVIIEDDEGWLDCVIRPHQPGS